MKFIPNQTMYTLSPTSSRSTRNRCTQDIYNSLTTIFLTTFGANDSFSSRVGTWNLELGTWKFEMETHFSFGMY